MNDAPSQSKKKFSANELWAEILDIESRISASVFAASSVVGIEGLRQQILDLTAGTLIREVSVDDAGRVDFSLLNERIRKLPPLWSLLVRRLLARTRGRIDDYAHLKIKAEYEIKAKMRYEEFFKSIGDGIMVFDKSGTISFINGALEEMMKWQEGEVLGKTCLEVMEFQDENGNVSLKEKRPDYSALFGKTIPASRYYYCVRKDRTRFPAFIIATPVKGAEIEDTIMLFKDMTLEAEFDRAKSDFVSIASHQLRTPLTAIMGITSMLIDLDLGPLNEKQMEFLKMVKESNDRMIELVNSLLNVSRIDLHIFAVESEPTDLQKVARSVLKEISMDIGKKRLRVTTAFDKELGPLETDPRLIRMVFQNLLSNAVKYTRPKDSISLAIRKVGTQILIEVSDSGLGVPAAAQSRIFVKMFRADNARKSDPNGTGLGLYIVKAIVEEMGGTIRFESEEDKGTAFFVSIPAVGIKTKMADKRLE